MFDELQQADQPSMFAPWTPDAAGGKDGGKPPWTGDGGGGSGDGGVGDLLQRDKGVGTINPGTDGTGTGGGGTDTTRELGAADLGMGDDAGDITPDVGAGDGAGPGDEMMAGKLTNKQINEMCKTPKALKTLSRILRGPGRWVAKGVWKVAEWDCRQMMKRLNKRK